MTNGVEPSTSSSSLTPANTATPTPRHRSRTSSSSSSSSHAALDFSALLHRRYPAPWVPPPAGAVGKSSSSLSAAASSLYVTDGVAVGGDGECCVDTSLFGQWDDEGEEVEAQAASSMDEHGGSSCTCTWEEADFASQAR